MKRIVRLIVLSWLFSSAAPALGIASSSRPWIRDVVGEQPALSELTRGRELEGIVLLAVLALVVVALLVERRNRRRVERALEQRVGLETLLADVLSEFAHCEPDDLSETLARALRHVAAFLHVDRATLLQLTDFQMSRSVQRGAADGRFVPVPTYPFADFSSVIDELTRGQIVKIATLADLPPALEPDRATFARLGIGSYLAFPIGSEGAVLGALALMTFGRLWECPESLVHRLRVVADVFSGVLMRQQAMRAALRSETLSTAVLDAAMNPVAVIDRTGVLRRANDAWMRAATDNRAARLCGVSLGASYLDLCRCRVARGDAAARRALDGIEQVLTGPQVRFAFEYEAGDPNDQHWYEVRVEAFPAFVGGAMISHVDVTARHDAEATLRRHQEEVAHFARIRTMAVFAASLAHELSQPLAAILSNAQAASRFLAGRHPKLDEVRAILEDIGADDQRAGEVIARMRGLLRRHEVEMADLNLNDVVREVAQLVHSDSVLRRVTFVSDLDETLPPVRADRVQVQQVLLNLILNGFEAVDGAAGERRVMLRTTHGAEGFAEVAVRDTGPGIPPEHIDRLFEAFFTTKREGLGMGLSISQAIAQGHGGRLWATNNSDCGATFHMAVPLVIRRAS